MSLPQAVQTGSGAPAESEKRALLGAGAAFGMLAVAVGAIVAVNSFAPDNLYALTPETWVSHVVRTILPARLLPLLAMLAAALLAAALAVLLAGPQLPAAAARGAAALDRHGPAAVGVLVAATAAAALLVGFAVLRAFPNSGDEYAYQFLARTLLDGRLWQELPARHEFFSIYQIFERDGKWVSQYPPGWPLVMAAGMALGLPAAAIGPLSGAAMMAALAALARSVLGWAGAVAVCVVVLVSGFFLLNAGSFFNHAFSAFLMLGFTICARRFLDRPGAAAALAGGAFIGMLGITRYYTALLCVLPFLASLIATRSRRHVRLSLWALPAIAPFLTGLLAYNQAITGAALTTVTAWGYPLLRLGLWGSTEAGLANSPLRAGVLAAIQLTEFMEWTSPLALAAYALGLGYLVARRQARFHDAYFLVFVLGYLLFPSIGGNRYGSRYYFEAYPFLVLTVATALDRFLRTALDRFLRTAHGGRLPSFLVCLGAAHLVIAAGNLPALLFFMHRVVVERMDLYDQVAAAGLDHAVVLIASGTGVLRPMVALDLTRNGTRIDGPVIYAHDLGRYNAALRELFPDRTFWRYCRAPDEVRGHLEPWHGQTPAPP